MGAENAPYINGEKGPTLLRGEGEGAGGEETEAVGGSFGAGLGDSGGRDERERLAAFITEVSGVFTALGEGDRRKGGRLEQ